MSLPIKDHLGIVVVFVGTAEDHRGKEVKVESIINLTMSPLWKMIWRP